ncbi:Leucine-rich repeat - like 10 [Theobroma cacao]|nr:Leucine-rich repeat - like 10 [Theobroma cacao]
MQGHNIINSLLNACLLEKGTYAESVMMHDVISDMALWIARVCEAVEKKFLVQARVRSIKALDVENWKGVRMSLAYSGIEDIRGTPICPNLQTLFLNTNKLRVISDGFFQFMHNLRVLTLSTNWELCELSEEISELVSLECLDLSYTGIRELPIKLNSCHNLRNVTWLILAPNLTWLTVLSCSRMEEIISEDANVVEIPNLSPFAKLEVIVLQDLSKLKSIYWDALPFPCLRHITIVNCPKLKKLPLNFESAKGNKISILGNEEWWKEVQWKDEATRVAFLPYFVCDD